MSYVVHTPQEFEPAITRREYKRTGAMLDRLLHRSVVLNIDGDSYRMRSHRARAEATRRAVAR